MANMFKLNPFYSEKVWGYEKWNLSTHRNGCSTLELTGESLFDYLGTQLPILNKIIKADESLSVQVHPGNEFTNKYENDNGKTECWYILEAEENATLICGIKKGLNKESLTQIVEAGNMEEYLEEISIQAGDMIYIPSGTVHAIKGGIKLLEIQQSSDVTYRLYDWGRDREMHIEKGLEVIDYNADQIGGKIENFTKLETPYFNVEKIVVDNTYADEVTAQFSTINVTKGSGMIYNHETQIVLNAEDTVYLTNGTKYRIEGDLEFLKTY